MFSGDWQESRDGLVNTCNGLLCTNLLFMAYRKVKIPFPYEVFYAFIVYLYTDEIHIKLEHVVGKILIGIIV